MPVLLVCKLLEDNESLHMEEYTEQRGVLKMWLPSHFKMQIRADVPEHHNSNCADVAGKAKESFNVSTPSALPNSQERPRDPPYLGSGGVKHHTDLCAHGRRRKVALELGTHAAAVEGNIQRAQRYVLVNFHKANFCQKSL